MYFVFYVLFSHYEDFCIILMKFFENYMKIIFFVTCENTKYSLWFIGVLEAQKVKKPRISSFSLNFIKNQLFREKLDFH